MKRKKMIKMGLFVFLMSLLSCGFVTAAEQMSAEESAEQLAISEKKTEPVILKFLIDELKKGNKGNKGRSMHEYKNTPLGSEVTKFKGDLCISLEDVFNENSDKFNERMQPNIYEDRSWLELDYLFLTSICGLDKFCGLTTLVVLSMTNNRLKTIPNNFFEYFSSLCHLNLSDNRLEEINKKMFIGLNQLTHLNLRGNKLKKIDEGAFSGLAKLTCLNLSRNELEEIKKDQFVGLYHSLQDLCLSENEKLLKLCATEILALEKLVILNFYKCNQLECNKELYQGLLKKFPKYHNYYLCLNPSESLMERVLSFPVNHPLIAAATASAVLVAAAIVSRNPAKARRAAEGMRNRCVIS